MHARSAGAALKPPMEYQDHVLQTATDRFERRLAEECGKLRVEIAAVRGDLRVELSEGLSGVRAEIGALRAEGIERNHELLKWALVFWATGVAAVAALLALFR